MRTGEETNAEAPSENAAPKKTSMGWRVFARPPKSALGRAPVLRDWGVRFKPQNRDVCPHTIIE